MPDRERARKLYLESEKYYLMDSRWRDNFRARLHYMAGQFDAGDPATDAVIVMFLDIAGHRIGVRPRWSNENE